MVGFSTQKQSFDDEELSNEMLMQIPPPEVNYAFTPALTVILGILYWWFRLSKKGDIHDDKMNRLETCILVFVPWVIIYTYVLIVTRSWSLFWANPFFWVLFVPATFDLSYQFLSLMKVSGT